MPFLIDASRGKHGTLVGHVARANPVWRPIAQQVATNRTQPAALRRQALFVLADKAEASDAREVLRAIALDTTDDREIRAQAIFWLSEVPGEELPAGR